MADETKNEQRQPAAMAGERVHRLAHQAIRVLSDEDVVRSGDLGRRLKVLEQAFLSSQEKARVRAIQRLRDDGVPVSAIIDDTIPEVARRLGERWADDSLSFAEVTIGTARLQEAVRSLTAHETSWNASSLDNPREGSSINPREGSSIVNTPRVLLIIPKGEDHTLGAFVAADQFRRLGYDVDIALDQHPARIAATLNQRRYGMVGITASARRTLASARDLVDIIRSTATRVTPIVLGGSMVTDEQGLKRATGVDHVAHTARDALEKCGLDIVEADPSQVLVSGHDE